MDLFSRVHALPFHRLSACCLFAALQGIMLNSLAVQQLSINQRILFFPTFPWKLHQQINQSGIDNSHEASSWKGIPTRLPRGEKQRKYLFKLEVISFILRRVDDESCFGCERTLASPLFIMCQKFSVNILIEFAHLKSFHSAA